MWQGVVGGSVVLISCWQVYERAVSLQRHPRSEASLMFNDASCQLCQSVSANELAAPAAQAVAAAPGNVARVSGGWGSTRAVKGAAGDSGWHGRPGSL